MLTGDMTCLWGWRVHMVKSGFLDISIFSFLAKYGGLNIFLRSLFVSFDSLSTSNNFLVISGQVFLVWTSIKQGLMRLKDTT